MAYHALYQRKGISYNIPAIPAFKTPQVYSIGTKHHDREHKPYTILLPYCPADARFNVPDRNHPGNYTIGRGREKYKQILPHRNYTPLPQMKKVSNYIHGIGQEQKPGSTIQPTLS